ncbi:MAG: sel1 repeat family protein [Polyangiaceae bacterium]|nr:sel1 repeat family protein [Polyangiaceae bacterium]
MHRPRSSQGLRRAPGALVVASLAAACGGPPTPVSPPPTAAPSAVESSKPVASAAPVEPAPPAKPALPAELASAEKACEGGDAGSCSELAIAYYKGTEVPADGSKAAELFRKACGLGHAQGCYNVGAMLFKGELGQAVDQPGSVPFFDKACSADYEGGCFNLGVMYLKAEGVAKDEAKGKRYMVSACRLGREQACEIVKELEAGAAAQAGPSEPGVPGATITMGSLSADGLEARNISCRLDGGGGLLGALVGPSVIIGSLAKKKAALDQCAPAGAQPRVTWSFAGGRTTKATASGVPANVGSCVERVIKGVASTGDGECAATLLIGKKK